MGLAFSWWVAGVALAVLGPLTVRVVTRRAGGRASDNTRALLARAENARRKPPETQTNERLTFCS
jgi:hypothetical protein